MMRCSPDSAGHPWPAPCFNGDRLLGKLTQVGPVHRSCTPIQSNISYSKRWIIDRATLKQARSEDLQYVESPEHIDFLNIYFANRRTFIRQPSPIPAHVYIHVVIAMLGKRLSLRQRVIASATVFFRRFYVKNLYCETDPFIVMAACCYVAAKAEESPVHIKNVVSESRLMFSRTCEPAYIRHL
jgi:cyclin C